MARPPKVPGETSAEPEAAEPAPVSTLPNSFEVDPHTITGPVLTRQGWVCPAPKPKG
jgi:hypothetical protein